VSTLARHPAPTTPALLLGQARLLILDLDGTLASIGPRVLRLGPALIREGRLLVHLAAAMSEARRLRAPDLDVVIAAGMAARGRTDTARARRVLDQVVDTDWPRLFAGARPPRGLERLLAAADQQGLQRAVFSDHPALDKLAAMGSGGWAAVCAGRRVGALKPHADGAWGLLAQVGVTPSEALLIGDRDDTDGGAAAALGCRFLHVAEVEAALGTGG
jgi:beta-phosphoglucomutase-like phosphatase (HAD superfamily)